MNECSFLLLIKIKSRHRLFDKITTLALHTKDQTAEVNYNNIQSEDSPPKAPKQGTKNIKLKSMRNSFQRNNQKWIYLSEHMSGNTKYNGHHSVTNLKLKDKNTINFCIYF